MLQIIKPINTFNNKKPAKILLFYGSLKKGKPCTNFFAKYIQIKELARSHRTRTIILTVLKNYFRKLTKLFI